jgi:DNA primase
MNAKDICELLNKLGCQKIKVDNSGKWVRSSCPFSRYRHSKGIDSHPSFGISIHPDGESKYHCFTCNEDGNLINFFWRLERLSSGAFKRQNFSELEGWVRQRNVPSFKSLNFRLSKIDHGWTKPKEVAGVEVSEFVARRLIEPEPEPLPESDLDLLQPIPDEVRFYLNTVRRLTDETILAWELKWHPKARRIGIPIRDFKGRLVGISGRAFDLNQVPKFLHSLGFRRDFYLFGEFRCRTGEIGYLTEGFFDVIYLRQQGYNAFAVMGSSISSIQVEKCLKFMTKAVIVPDGDKAGLQGADKIKSALTIRGLPVRVVEMPDGKDPDNLTSEELQLLLDNCI